MRHLNQVHNEDIIEDKKVMRCLNQVHSEDTVKDKNVMRRLNQVHNEDTIDKNVMSHLNQVHDETIEEDKVTIAVMCDETDDDELKQELQETDENIVLEESNVILSNGMDEEAYCILFEIDNVADN